MESKEIKKAFEQMKKDLKKECGISGGFTMNAKQIVNRTATYCVRSSRPYETLIASAKRDIADAQNMADHDWVADFTKRSYEKIHKWEMLMSEYGTPFHQTKAEMNRIARSAAFKKFQDAVGETRMTIEEKDNAYYIRFTY